MVFWDSKGIILTDYKPTGTSITGEYYANVIKQLRVAIKEKRRGQLAADVFLSHDNAPVRKSRVAQVTIHECKFKQLYHPPYSPDLAPSDYYLFRNLKTHLRGFLIVLGFNDTSTLEGHFVSSPREREKRDRRESRGDEREGQGGKKNRNESEETEEIKTFPLYPYPLQG